jgi:UDP-N-acetylmuramoylalanine--D-glutamate ligase
VAFDANDAAAAAATAGARSRRIPVAGDYCPPGGNGPEGDHLIVGDVAYPRPQLDPVWQFDVAVAATLAQAAGASEAGVAEVLASFQPGQHRRTVVAEIAGVTWVNDSKATNPHAAVASASAYPSVILIAGGRNKDLDLAPLVHAPTVKRVLALGESASDLHAVDPQKVLVVFDLEDAVAQARTLATAGDTVLLAPGCASFDMFQSYAHRGDLFTALVQQGEGEHGP